MIGRVIIPHWEQAELYSKIVMHNKDFKSLEDLLLFLIKTNVFILHRGFCTYAESLQIDLENGEVYFPFVNYKTLQLSEDDMTEKEKIYFDVKNREAQLYYNHTLEKLVILKYNIFKRRYELQLDQLTFLGAIDDHFQIYTVNLSELPLSQGRDKCSSIIPLYQRYLTAAIKPNKVADKHHIRTHYTYNTGKEINFIKERKLDEKPLGILEDTFCFPEQSLRDVKKLYPSIVEFTGMPTVLRRLTFLIVMLFDIVDGVEYKDLTKGSMSELYSDKCSAVEYTCKNVTFKIPRHLVLPKIGGMKDVY